MNLIEEFEDARVYRNLQIILGTIKNSCPLMRDLGLSNTFIDSPTPKVKATLNAEIITQCKKFLPEIEIISIDYEDLENGIKPKIYYKINRDKL